MYKAEREVKKLRAKHAACTIVIRNAGETIRDLAKSCGVAATTICALNHYRRHLVRGVRARSARLLIISLKYHCNHSRIREIFKSYLSNTTSITH